MGTRVRAANKSVPTRDASEEAKAGVRTWRVDAEAPAGEGRFGEEHDLEERQEEGESYEKNAGAREVGRTSKN